MSTPSSYRDGSFPLGSQTLLHECPDCGMFNGLSQPVAGMDLHCRRCNRVLRRVRDHSLDAILAYTVAGLFFYIVAIAVPLLHAAIYGSFRTSALTGGPLALDDEGMWMLASLVFLTTILTPLIKLGGVLVVLIGLKLSRPPSWISYLFGMLQHISPWAMIEVYLLGLLVAYTRLQVMMHVTPGEAVFALFGLMMAMVAVDAMLDPETVWEKIKRAREGQGTKKVGGRLIGCDTCYQVSRAAPFDDCPRCTFILEERKPNSLARTCAFMIAAAVLYIPSNIFPVMTITKFGQSHSYTIIGGIQELVRVGLAPIAVLVFVVSVVIPLCKLMVLGFLLVQTHARSSRGLQQRTRLYRIINFIGRWSMLDVFVVSVLVALVNFGPGNQITAEKGIAFFASVVVLTLFAVESFDSRLMWDAAMTKITHSVKSLRVTESSHP